jgi:hypothetical protein
MVNRDMVTRLRPALGVLAALALLIVSALSVAGASATSASTGRADGVVTMVEVTLTRPAAVPRVPRPLALPLAMATALALVAMVATYSLHERLSRIRPCLGDVGDDWRSLLLGAPPARA